MKKSIFNNLYILALCLFTAFLVGCEKYLDEKSDIKLVIPATLADLQALLDNYSNTININFAEGGQVSSDDYYLTDTDYSAASTEYEQRMYTWQPAFLFGGETYYNSWFTCYNSIYTCSSVLEAMETMEQSGEYNNIKGQALFWRAFRLLDAAQVWCPAYDEGTAAADLGLPLRTDPDFNVLSVRASVKDTYASILTDLTVAAPLLPVVPVSRFRPSRPAAFALLARTYLFMCRYDEAARYADSCLNLYNKLLDYNQLNSAERFPLQQLNDEVLLHASMFYASPLANGTARVDTTLYSMYGSGDLRPGMFFNRNSDGSVGFKGNYTGNAGLFSGLSTNEVFLMTAECNARLGNIDKAVSKLAELLIKRRERSLTLPAVEGLSQDKLLAFILDERRKELLMRGIRWADIKRLNKEGAGIGLSRKVNGSVYSLAPNDPRFALPIPEEVINRSGMQQNPR